MLKNNIDSSQNNGNEVLTYIAIPLEVFQACTEQQNQPMTVTQNVIIKTLPDGKMCIIDTNHFLNSQNVKDLEQTEKINIIDKDVVPAATKSKSVKLSNIPNTILVKSDSKNDSKKVKVRYLKCKVGHAVKKPTGSNNKENKEKPEHLKCPICGELFEKMMQYKKHMEMHRNTKKYKCEHCLASYNVLDNWKLHSAMHAKGEPTCPMCNRKFQRIASLKAHLMMHEVDETFTCIECLAEFDKEEELIKHATVHAKNENETTTLPLICSFCNYLFDDPDEYKKHVAFHIKIKKFVLNGKRRKQNTNKEYVHKCTVCQKSFPKFCLLERHMRIHSGEKPFVCNYCDRGFAQKGTLQIHLSKHTGIKRFKCTLCPAQFNQKGNLRVHVEKTHIAPVPGEKIYKCTMCTCIFKKVASLNGHITRAHTNETKTDIKTVMNSLKQLEKHTKNTITNENEKNINTTSTIQKVQSTTESNEINSSFSFVKLADSSIDGNIRRYVVKQRKAGDIRWYICSYCGKEFKKPSDLIRHIRVHTRERPFKCKQCGQSFSLKSTLASHLNTHIGKREYKCVICLKMFTSVRTLNVHIRKHNKNASSKQTQHYKCNTCNKMFNSVSKAKIHMTTHCSNENGKNEIEVEVVMKQPMLATANGLLPVAAPKPRIPYADMEQYKYRPYRCSICSAAFTKPLHVKRHMLMHTGEKKFKCEICDKSFYTSYALKQHTNFHKGIKNFVCKVCNKRFVTNAILKRHLTMHSSAKPYVCPYCEKRFKTVMLCRKHINIHKRDIKMQFHALSETGELSSLEPSDAAKIIGLDENSTIVAQENVSTSEEADKTKANKNQDNSVQQKIVYNNSSAKEIVFDPNSVLLPSEDNVNVIQNVFDQQQLYQVPVDATMQLVVNGLDGEQIIEGVHDINETGFQPTIFITAEELQALNGNVYNTLLPQLKIHNESLLLNNLSDLQDSNILFPVDALNSSVEFQNEPQQNFDQLNQSLIFNNSTLDITVEDKNAAGELSCLPSINEITNKPVHLASFVNAALHKEEKTNLNVNDDLYLGIPDEPTKSDINFFNDIAFTNSADINNLALNLNQLNADQTFDSTINENVQLNLYGSAEFVCSVCKNIFTSLKMLQIHKCASEEQQKESEKIASKTNTCIQCDKSFSSRASYLKHVAVHKHKKMELLHQCSYCEKSFKKPSDLTRHLRTHTGEKPYSCNKCDKSFSLKSTLESHYKTHNPGGNKEHNCQVCNSYFSTKASLKVHMLLHTGVKPYQCSMCLAKFRTAAHRKSHETYHMKSNKNEQSRNSKINNLIASIMMDTNQISHQPQLDSDILVTENALLDGTAAESVDITQTIQIDPLLLQQLQSSGLLLQENVENDVLVGSNFVELNVDGATSTSTVINTKPILNNYVEVSDSLQTNNNSNLQQINSKNFECTICHKKYSSKSILTKHRKIHGQLKKFQCSKCDKGFNSNDALEKHQKLHSGYRPFSCQLCANSFSEEGNLKTHMRRIHRIHQVSKTLEEPINIQIQENFINTI